MHCLFLLLLLLLLLLKPSVESQSVCIPRPQSIAGVFISGLQHSNGASALSTLLILRNHLKSSYPQQVAVTCTGIIWSRYSTVITPKNWNLFSVNVAMAGTGLYQLSRKIRQDFFSDEKEATPALEG